MSEKDDLIERAESQLKIFGRITTTVGAELLERVVRYQSALKRIAALPEPLPKQIAKDAIKKA